MHASNWKKKTTRSAKKNKNNFINVIEDKFAMSIRWEKKNLSAFQLYKLSSVTYISNKMSN